MASSQKDRKKARLRDITSDADGNVSYTGQLYRLVRSEGHPGRAEIALCVVITAVLVAASGLIDADNAIGSFYVIIPYIGEVSAMFFLAWNSAKVLASSDVRQYVRDEASPRITGSCRMLTVFAVIGLAMSALYLILNGTGDKPAGSFVYLALKCAAAAAAEVCRRLFIKADWEQIN